ARLMALEETSMAWPERSRLLHDRLRSAPLGAAAHPRQLRAALHAGLLSGRHPAGVFRFRQSSKTNFGHIARNNVTTCEFRKNIATASHSSLSGFLKSS